MLVAVSRVLNEDDIVEAFVRHTLAFADRMILLDDGSIDRTAEIPRALRDEGAPLVLLQAQSVVFSETQHNTMLYHTADRAFAPAWVLCLDADEFIDARPGDLRALLGAVPAETQSVQVRLRNYFAEGVDAADLLVPRRMVMRDASDRGVLKCFVRGNIGPEISIAAGNHSAFIGGDPLPAGALPGLNLAHYPVRHPIQGLAKALLGRLKVLAAGGGEELTQQTANHYTPVLEALCNNPAQLLLDPGFLGGALPAMPLVEDPIAYAGGELRYTRPIDAGMKALRGMAHAAERLARSHGQLLDNDPALRNRTLTLSMHAELMAP